MTGKSLHSQSISGAKAVVVLSVLVLIFPGPKWAVSETAILFTSSASGNWDLWRVNPDGSELTQVTNTSEDEHAPDASPDGSRIACVNGTSQIWVMHQDGTGQCKVSGALTNCAYPAWHPDGKRLVFVSYTVKGPGQEDSELYEVVFENGNAGPVRLLFPLPGVEVYPAWSPKGDVVAFSRFVRDSRGQAIEELWLKAADTEEPVALTQTGADNFAATWSPDGNRIAYASNASGNYDIWVVDVKEGTRQKLTDVLAYDGLPRWSPDGANIMFISTRTGIKQIWTMNTDGSHQQAITTDPAEKADPCWLVLGRN